MSAKIFKTPSWDDEISVPQKTFNFKKKSNKKKKPKTANNQPDFSSYEPGRYVKLHRSSEPGSKKRKLEEAKDTSIENGKKIKKKTDEITVPAKKKKKLENIPFTTKVSQTAEPIDEPADENPNSFRQTLIDNLKGSRFRYLNELLYTKPSDEATGVFQDDPTSFQAYHDGYRQQVQQWPLNPLDRIIKALKRLPRNLVVADFGCGEARLARSIPQKTYSLDLVAKTDDIIACDMANSPLETGSIDVVVFCLSLMGTNTKDFILEANRVLKDGGLLKIAEVESRFTDIRHFVSNIKQCGFEMVHQDLSNNLFYFMNFKKTKMVKKTSKNVKAFSLKPCIYKKR
ncbi:Ribosomal RNA-processing protein 8 [Pseudolycoriella hygida]|uniref:Ribosomal RNA-processing protein 8 n=1 Tax=Pseudolycoriella hygida TaxID=35572 RepID=A0A9Q0RTB6_9DIPT|nr:Ribosomal RNA-processing protein 8 [Pseudolycoriella hygida]